MAVAVTVAVIAAVAVVMTVTEDWVTSVDGVGVQF